MHLTPREQERLTIFTVAELARRRRRRGRRLNVPEAIALICDEVLEWAWDGAELTEVIAAARSVLTADDVMDGVAALVPHVQVEAVFPSGTALVAIDEPIRGAEAEGPGAVRCAPGEVELNAGRQRSRLPVRNRGDQPVFVSSHFPLHAVNDVLELDRELARGKRLDVPAGYAVEFAPGEQREVDVVALAPARSPEPEPGPARSAEPGPGPEAGQEGR